jgi:hypothetical protein
MDKIVGEKMDKREGKKVKKINFKKVSYILIPLLCILPCFMIYKSVSSSRITLKDQAKIDRIILHNAKGGHLCHCYAPMIAANPGFEISNKTSTSASFRWVCDVASSYQVNYGTTSGKGTLFPSAKPSATYKDYTVTVTGLKPNTLYHACMHSQAPGRSDFKEHTGGTTTGAMDWTFTTLADGGGLSIKGSILDSKNAGISGVKVTISGDSSGSVTTTSTGTYEFANLKQGKNYTITPTKDKSTFNPPSKSYSALAADQPTQNFAAVTVSVKNNSEPTIVISDVTATKVLASEANITWKTNFLSTSQVEYGATKNLGLKTGENLELTTDHYIQLFDLKPGATYYFRTISRPGEGTTPVSSSDFSLKTQSFEKRISDKNNYWVEPNPCSDRTEFDYFLYQPVNNLTIDIFTLSGKKVAVLEAPPSALNTGYNRISWDVKDRSGAPLVNGLYVYKMKFTKGGAEEVYQSAQLSVRR